MQNHVAGSSKDAKEGLAFNKLLIKLFSNTSRETVDVRENIFWEIKREE